MERGPNLVKEDALWMLQWLMYADDAILIAHGYGSECCVEVVVMQVDCASKQDVFIYYNSYFEFETNLLNSDWRMTIFFYLLNYKMLLKTNYYFLFFHSYNSINIFLWLVKI